VTFYMIVLTMDISFYLVENIGARK